MALKDEPKVQELISKAEAKAVAGERKRIQASIKAEIVEAKANVNNEDKVVVKAHVAGLNRALHLTKPLEAATVGE